METFPLREVAPCPSTPLRVDFEVTNFCNLNCSYCSAKPFRSELPSLHRLRIIFEKTRTEVNPFEVLITGGEPFSRKDIVNLLVEAKEIFGSVAVVTNGTLLPRLRRSELRELKKNYGDGSLQVSLDSVDPDTNNRLRGGTRQVLKGLDILEENGIQFTIGIVMTRYNLPTLKDTLSYLFRRYYSMVGINLLQLRPSIELGKKYLELGTNYDDLVQAFKLAQRIGMETRRFDLNVQLTKEKLSVETLLETAKSGLCSAGMLHAGVLVNGDVVPCTILRTKVLGNLYQESWQEIWARARAQHERLQAVPTITEQCYHTYIDTIEA